MGSLQGKAIGDSFSTDQNFKIRIAGPLWEEAGPCSDYTFFLPEVRTPPPPYMHREAFWRSKGSDAN